MHTQLPLVYTIVLKSNCTTATLEWRQQFPHECAAEGLWALGKNLIEKHLNAYTETIASTFLWSKTKLKPVTSATKVKAKGRLLHHKPNIS